MARFEAGVAGGVVASFETVQAALDFVQFTPKDDTKPWVRLSKCQAIDSFVVVAGVHMTKMPSDLTAEEAHLLSAWSFVSEHSKRVLDFIDDAGAAGVDRHTVETSGLRVALKHALNEGAVVVSSIDGTVRRPHQECLHVRQRNTSPV